MHLSSLISPLIFALAAILNAYMDRYMMKWDLLPYKDQIALNPSWFSFNPAAKWKDGKFNAIKADNLLLSKIGIHTKWLSTNCNDAWHFFKSSMVILITMSIIFYKEICPYGLDILLYGAIWNISFNITLNKNK